MSIIFKQTRYINLLKLLIMKQYQIQFNQSKSRQTLSDLKLKKTIQSNQQQKQLTKINNSVKFRGAKLSPIIGQITVIPIKPQALKVKDILIGKQLVKIQGGILTHYRNKRNLCSKPIVKYLKTQNKEQVKSQHRTQIGTIQLSPTPKLQQSLRKQQKKSSTTTSPIRLQSKTKNLPKIQLQKFISVKLDRPLLSSMDINLRTIKSIHYFVLQHQTKTHVIAHRSKIKIQVASLTKIMTFYTIYKICLQFFINIKNTEIQITHNMTDVSGTTALLEENQVYTVEQLLYGLMLPSGNDAALALAIWGGKMLGNVTQDNSNNNKPLKNFVERMNFYARQLRMLDTNYGNCHGLPHKDNRTTCEDVAKLCSFCLQIPLFKQVVSTKVYRFKFYHTVYKKRLASHWQNTNKLLRRAGFIGIKTGITVTAGPCLASAYEFLGKTYIVIIAKSNKPSRRFKQTRKILVHCLQRIDHGRVLTQQQQKTIKRLSRTNQDVDSDYSDEQIQFNFSSFSPSQIKRRNRILTQI